MMGDSLLVAPLFGDETERDVEFTSGSWFDFYTGVHAGDEGVHRTAAPVDCIPLFVRDGAIIPLDNHDGSMEYRYYGVADAGATRLYVDDGETYAYEQGDYAWVELTAARTQDGLQGAVAAPSGGDYDRLRDGAWRAMTNGS